MSVISIVNQKGGVGKTTTAVTLGHGLALSGKRVLLIDLDSQGNVADCLGLDEGGELFQLLAPSDVRITPQEIAYPSGRDRLDVIRSNKTTAQLKLMLAGDEWSVFRLHETLKDATHDFIILDCAPSVDLLQTAAVLTSDYVLVPTRLDQLSMKGVRDVLKTIKAVRQRTKYEIQVAGILPTFYDRVTSESYEQLRHLAKTFGKMVMPPIPIDTRCRVSSRYGKTLWEFSPNSRSIMGYSTSNGRNIGGYKDLITRIRKLT
jgi:chromosome partitioning protein